MGLTSSGRARLASAVLVAAGLALLFARAVPQAQPKSSACSVETKERVVSVGDVHGAFDRFVAILTEAGLINKDKNWSGGKAILVQTGDILDRGPDSKKALDLLRKLEDQSAKAGGHVYALLGNHEVMRMIQDRRYISPAEYKAFQSVDSTQLRDAYYEKYLAAKITQLSKAGEKVDTGAIRKKFQDEIPLGSVEMQQAFSDTGEYGQWLRGHDTIAIVNGVAYMHGGLSTLFASLGCAQLNTTVRAELKSPPTGHLSEEEVTKLPFMSSVGPLWYRGLVKKTDGTPGSDVNDADYDAILKSIGARAMVVGHTPTSDAKIHVLYGDRLFQTDTGMLGDYAKAGSLKELYAGIAPPEQGWFPGGVSSALEMLGGTVTAIYEGGKREVLVEGPKSGGR